MLYKTTESRQRTNGNYEFTISLQNGLFTAETLEHMHNIASQLNASVFVYADNLIMVLCNKNYEDTCQVWIELCCFLEGMGMVPHYLI